MLSDLRANVINHLPASLVFNLIDFHSLSLYKRCCIDITNEHLHIFIC